ncbi:MAG TPA: hypothetical protein GYA10_05095 [Alphaproteobacteria bacterium]|nr:hypothetical protein [Alphaproteobacteria bacterium]
MWGKIGLALAVLGLASMGSAADAADGSLRSQLDRSKVKAAPAGQAPAGEVLLSDDFTANWGTGTDENSSIEYRNNQLQVVVFTKNWFVWSTPDGRSYERIHMEVTVNNNDADSTTAIGFMCNKAPASADFHYLAMTPAGQYAIARAQEGQNDVFLTNGGKWANSSAIRQNAASYRIGADCGDELVLYVDGVEIARAADSSYRSGGVGLIVWSGEQATRTDVSFDDFVMTSLR